MRHAVTIVAALVLAATLGVPLPAAAAPHCAPGEVPAFRDAFAQLRADLGPVMGEPASCWYVKAGHDGVFQDTTTGLAYHWPVVWLTVFTDGQRRWALTTHGPAYWEGSESAPPERSCGWGPGGEPAVSRLGAYAGPEPPPHWTVIAGSFETREEAERLGGRLCVAGLQDADVLRSDDYGSLRPGYWVAHAGRFPSRAQAAAAADRMRALGFDGTYPRELRR